LQVYSPTGHNSNFAYMNTNQQTIANGLGVGGAIEPAHYFSLWLNDDFATGKSQAKATTFNSPQLSSESTFHIDSIEVLATEQIIPDLNADNTTQKSILDVDPTVNALLEIAGRKMHSKGLREGEFVHNESMPEEHDLYPTSTTQND